MGMPTLLATHLAKRAGGGFNASGDDAIQGVRTSASRSENQSQRQKRAGAIRAVAAFENTPSKRYWPSMTLVVPSTATKFSCIAGEAV